jgi:hypothetical protein
MVYGVFPFSFLCLSFLVQTQIPFSQIGNSQFPFYPYRTFWKQTLIFDNNISNTLIIHEWISQPYCFILLTWWYWIPGEEYWSSPRTACRSKLIHLTLNSDIFVWDVISNPLNRTRLDFKLSSHFDNLVPRVFLRTVGILIQLRGPEI